MARRPARTHCAVGRKHVDLLRTDASSLADDDFELAVIVQIGRSQRAKLADAAERIPEPDLAAEAVVDNQLVGIAADDHFGRTVTGQVGNDDSRPHATRVLCSPLEAAAGAIQRDDVVGAPDNLGLAVPVEVGDNGGGIPAGLTVRARQAAAILPHQDGRAHARDGPGPPNAEPQCQRDEGAKLEPETHAIFRT